MLFRGNPIFLMRNEKIERKFSDNGRNFRENEVENFVKIHRNSQTF